MILARQPRSSARCAQRRYSRPRINRLMRAGKFPLTIKLGGNRVGFVENEIEAWIEEKTRARDERQARRQGA
jgi:predicted DNA-binding transcriptional regulator AlpA